MIHNWLAKSLSVVQLHRSYTSRNSSTRVSDKLSEVSKWLLIKNKFQVQACLIKYKSTKWDNLSTQLTPQLLVPRDDLPLMTQLCPCTLEWLILLQNSSTKMEDKPIHTALITLISQTKLREVTATSMEPRTKIRPQLSQRLSLMAQPKAINASTSQQSASISHHSNRSNT